MTEAYKSHYWKAFQRQRDGFQAMVTKRIIRALNAQFDQFMEGTENIQTNGEWYANLQNVSEEPIRQAFQEIYPLVGIFFAKSTNTSLNQTYRLQLASGEPVLTKKDQADDMEGAWLSFLRLYALEKAGERIVQITTTTLNEIRKILDKGIAEGLSVQKIGRTLRTRFSEITKWRGEMIARTEIVSASNKGSLIGAEATGLVLNKNWLSTRDARTRPDHILADGQERPVREDFFVGGEFMECPGDPDASASQTIACRCTITFDVV